MATGVSLVHRENRGAGVSNVASLHQDSGLPCGPPPHPRRPAQWVEGSSIAIAAQVATVAQI